MKIIRMFQKAFVKSKHFTFLLFLKSSHMHVRISDKGREVLNNKTLASKLVETVMKNKKELERGDRVKVDHEKLSVKLVTTLEEAPRK